MTKQELLSHRIDKPTKLSAQRKARESGRSLSGYIRYLIMMDLKNE